MVAVLLLYGFFLTLHYLLGMLPRDNEAADRIPGEYWLFVGQALGILGSLALNVATYYFGSSSSGEDGPGDQVDPQAGRMPKKPKDPRSTTQHEPGAAE